MLLAACGFVFLASVYAIIERYQEGREQKKFHESVKHQYLADTEPDRRGELNAATPTPTLQPSSTAEPELLPGFEQLLQINEETVGWLSVPNTNIEYPVVQTKDNSFYLEHDFKKEKAENGAVFMDYRNSPDAGDKHNILYGHYTKDGTIFTELRAYRQEAFLRRNPVLTFNTLHEEGQWEIFSVYVTDTKFYYIQTDFRSKRDFADFAKTLKEKSIYSLDVEITGEDRILTLSTCAYDYDDARLVIHAKRVNSP
jgi:sortase B